MVAASPGRPLATQGRLRDVDLQLRPIGPGDGPLLRELVAHPEVWAWLAPRSGDGPAAAAQCAAWARRDAAHWDLHGFGKWIVSEAGTPVARGGLSVTFLEGRPEVEIGWAVAREHWGRGIATHIARAALREAEHLGLRGVVAFARTENAASLRVMEKAGLQRERELEHAGWPHILYRSVA
jgi:RimJ/RimL family protein N-acetyltransferase